MSLKKPHILPFLLATVLLLACGHHRYDGELALVDSLQKLDSAYLSDSLLQPIVRYYDRYGTRNQQARAHYLLGQIQTMVTNSLTKVKLNIYGWIF